MEQLEKFLEWGGVRKDVTCLILSGAALLVSIFHLLPLPFDAAWVAIVLCGVPILLEAFIGLVTRFDIKADVLVSIALVASVIIGEDFAAGEVAFIMQLGALLEDLTVARARAGIEKLVRLTPRTARRVLENGEEIVPAEQVRLGDRLRVLPGETVPVDGVILSGRTSINQAVMTGESLPVDKGEGDEVSSGTVNQFGTFDMRASRVGEDSSIQRMIRLVQKSENCGHCGSLGDLGGGYRAGLCRCHGFSDGRGDPRCDHPGRVLSLCACAGNAHGDYGRNRKRNQARIPGPGRRCAGASFLRFLPDL